MIRRGAHLRPMSQGPGQAKALAGGTLNSNAGTDKSVLRKQLRALRAGIRPADRSLAARRAASRLLGMMEVRRARHVAVYLAAGSELGTRPLIHALRKRGKLLSAPRIVPGRPGRMRMLPLAAGRPLRRNRYGIAEPRSSREPRHQKIDVAIIPLVGFDARGTRLGSGAGYYDRWLAGAWPPPYRVGYGFANQEIPRIPSEPWDLSLDAVCTERGVRRCARTRKGVRAWRTG